MAVPTEEMFFFAGPRGVRLLGFLHPSLRPGPPAGAVLYCHPFAEERNLAQGVAVRTARKLAAAGFAVLRFDFSGCGDSEGRLEDADPADWLAEIGAAADVLKSRAGVDRLGVWGLRSGAGLAALWARGRSDLDFAMLQQPVTDFKMFMTQFLRQKIASGLTGGEGPKATVSSLVDSLRAGAIVEVMGYPVSARLHAGLTALGSIVPAAAELACRACVLSISEGDEAPDPLARLVAGMGDAHPRALQHVNEVPFWDRYWRWEAPLTEDATVAWITGG